jgi:ubiquinone/menaquinone biosynthesis C-methylase UbiE
LSKGRSRLLEVLDRELFPRINDAVLGERVRDLRREVVEGAHGEVLEIGAGTGLNFEHYRAPSVVALEPNEGMRRRAAERAPPGVAVVDGRCEALPFDDASFDVVVSTFVFCSVRDLTAALSEIHRVLRPGGELRLVEHGISTDDLEARLQRFVRPAWRSVFGGCDPTRDVPSALSGAGFEISRLSRRALPLPYLARPGFFGAAIRR